MAWVVPAILGTIQVAKMMSDKANQHDPEPDLAAQNKARMQGTPGSSALGFQQPGPGMQGAPAAGGAGTRLRELLNGQGAGALTHNPVFGGGSLPPQAQASPTIGAGSISGLPPSTIGGTGYQPPPQEAMPQQAAQTSNTPATTGGGLSGQDYAALGQSLASLLRGNPAQSGPSLARPAPAYQPSALQFLNRR